MFLDKEQVNSLILKLGLVTQEDFSMAKQEVEEINYLSEEGEEININEILLRKGLISEEELREIQGRVARVDFIDLENKEIDENILLSIPEPIARKYNIIAFDRNSDVLKLAVLDLEILEKINFLKKQVALKIKPYLTNRLSINQNLLKYQRILKDEYGFTIQKEFSAFQTISEDFLEKLPREKILELARDKRINNVFELFLKNALLQKASNIHIEPHQDKTLIKYRIGGKLYSAMVLPRNSSIILNLKISVLLGIDSKKKTSHFSIGFDGKEVVFQVNKVKSLWGERIVLKVLYQGESGFSFESLGFHGRALDILYSEIDKREKTILITGEENSGKTTTFYTFLDSLNDFSLGIGTIENSIGFQMSGVTQTVVNSKIGFDISQGIDKLEKQNLDILGIDEIENSKDLKNIFKSSWEDRFNIAVLETQENLGSEIIFKLKELEINPVVIVSNLSTIISQKLVQELSIENRIEYFLSVDEIKRISKRKDVDMEKVMKVLVEEGVLKEKKSWSEVVFFKQKEQKRESSLVEVTEGRRKVLVSQIFKISPVIKEMILNNSTKKELEEQASKEGIMTLAEEMIFKAVQGVISIEKVL